MMKLRCALPLIGLCWMLSQSVTADDLPDRIRNAAFQPIDDATLQQRRLAAADALRVAESMLQYAGSGPAWQDYLLFDPLRDALINNQIDDDAIAAVTATMYRLAGLHDGIERPALTRLRSNLVDLRRGLVLARRQADAAEKLAQFQLDLEQFPDDPELLAERPMSLEQAFADRQAELAELVTQLHAATTAAPYRRLAELTAWFQSHEQLPGELRRIADRFGRANTHVDIAAPALATITARQVTEIEPIRENKDKVQVTGQAVLTGVATMHPVSGHAPGQCEVRFQGNIQSTMNGRQGPVSFTLRGDTVLTAQKTVIFAEHQFVTLKGTAQANSDLRTEQVCSKFRGGIGKLVRRIAGNEIAKEQPQARHDLSRRSSDSFLKRFDEDIVQEIAEARSDFELEVQRSLLRLNVQPKTIDFLTDPSKLTLALRFDSGLSQPAYAAVPQTATGDIVVTLHESTVGSVCQRIYAGRKIDNIRRELKVLGIKLSEEEEKQIPEGMGIHFAEDRPIEVEFEGNKISMILRGQTWFLDKTPLVAMNVRFGYTLEPRDGMFVAVRGEDVQVTAPEGMRGGRFIQQMNVLKRRLLQELPQEFKFEPIPVSKLPDPVNRLGTLNVVKVQTAGGWLNAGLQGDRSRP
ncbi:hypothetical protein Poly24_29070 [Rosistilla carotiformis]|uniref:Uncharacterized protein n=1 Tax=Rosistilla carotiformis TaxID=2528017 RepID=A0A518JUH9_9BACT|nr:hypothetical protein [Rosistilla carotiformis]QDV69192.1 hypothetical protein Poly24_29070 [Rosistilla carotiformis]